MQVSSSIVHLTVTKCMPEQKNIDFQIENLILIKLSCSKIEKTSVSLLEVCPAFDAGPALDAVGGGHLDGRQPSKSIRGVGVESLIV